MEKIFEYLLVHFFNKHILLNGVASLIGVKCDDLEE